MLFLLMAMGADNIIDRSVYGEWYGKPGDRLTEALNILRIVISLSLVWWGFHKTEVPRFNRVLPLAAVSFLLVSVLWSVTPMLTVTRGVAYFFLVVGAIGIVELLENDGLMDLIGLAAGFSAVASVLLALISPDAARPGLALGGTELRGIFAAKNTLGQVMVVGVLAGLHGLQIVGRRRFRYLCLVILCTVVAFDTKSGTSILIIFVFFGLWVLTTLYTRDVAARVLSICLAIGLIPIVIFLMSNQDLIFGIMERDSTLTGRTLLWPYVIDMIYRAPVLGWGFQAFWSPSNPLALEISAAVGWGFLVPEAHNGLLELLLQIGFVGTALFLFILIRNFTMAVKCIHGSAQEIGASSLLFLVGIVILSVSETVLLTPDQFSSVQFFMMGFMCEKMLWRARNGQRDIFSHTASTAPALGDRSSNLVR
jgi:exopolysaccharide production protein ExoQ